MRRYDLDWLRVLVFGLLIFYHVGMFFVISDEDWKWHIKNNITYEWIKYPMRLLNQWRLPILFVISGMGTYYALAKRTIIQFIFERLKKLFIPLVFGMLVVVPPQLYYEELAKGKIQGSFFDFYPSQLFKGQYSVMNLDWHHLWFLPYLLLFSLVLVPIFSYLRKNTSNFLFKTTAKMCTSIFGLYWLVLPLYILEAFVDPFFEDYFLFFNGILLFFIGFLLISIGDVFWETVEQNRKTYLKIALIGFASFLLLTIPFKDGVVRHFIEAFITVTTSVSWILCLFGFASKYLNQSSKILAYCNEAVYPLYILHQTITVILGYFIMNLEWAVFYKFIFLSLGTFLMSWFIYEFFIRRWNLMRLFFGLRYFKKNVNQKL